MSRTIIVAANFKMNGDHSLIHKMASGLKDCKMSETTKVVVCPSFPYLAAFTQQKIDKNLSDKISLGCQNISEQDEGAFTGEVSAKMLIDVGVQYVIVGHSERRTMYKETSTLVAQKVAKVISSGLTPILCIGESELERANAQTNVILASQLLPVIDEIGIKKFRDVVIAYEHVWAIGTGKTSSPEMAQDTHQYIRQFLAEHDAEISKAISILYGGSVNAANCNELFAQAGRKLGKRHGNPRARFQEGG